MAFRRHAGMQVGQRLAVIEPAAGRHETVEQRQHAIGAVGEGTQNLVRVDARALTPFIKPGLGARCFLGRWKKQECEKIARYEMCAGFFEVGLALGIDQSRRGIGKDVVGIGGSLVPLRLDENAPAQAKAAESVVDAARNGNQLGRDGGIQIRTPKAGRALKRAILVQHDAGSDQSDPWQIVGEASGSATIFGEIHHGRLLTPRGKPECADACARPRQRADRDGPPRRPRNDRLPRW